MNIVRLRDLHPVPWKNGCGETVEIARTPAGDGPAIWRLSRAVIAQDAQFSAFPGIERILVLAAGRGLRLDFSTGPAIDLDRIGETARFSGSRPVIGRPVGGPAVAVNVMFDPSKVVASAEILSISGEARISAAAVHILEGRVEADTVLGPGDTAVAHGPAPLHLVAGSRVLAVALSMAPV